MHTCVFTCKAMKSLTKTTWIVSNILLYSCVTSSASRCLNHSHSSPMSPTGVVVGYVTINNSDQAKQLARKLVTSKLVACVNIIPNIVSIYEWKQKLEEDDESLLIIKAQSHLQNDIVEFVKTNHPYDVPEVIFAPIVAGNPDYLNWVARVPSHKSPPSS